MVNFYLGLLAFFVLSLYRSERLCQYGKHTVGEVQSSNIEIQMTKDSNEILFILNVVFQVQHCQETLDTTE